MMMFHLRKIGLISGIFVKDIVEKMYSQLIQMNLSQIQEGSIGWGVPMLFAALKDYDNEISKKISEKTYNLIINKYITHNNFRTRSMSAWSLVVNYENI